MKPKMTKFQRSDGTIMILLKYYLILFLLAVGSVLYARSDLHSLPTDIHVGPQGKDVLPSSRPETQHPDTTLLRYEEGAIVRGPTKEKIIFLVFTGHQFAEGGESIRKVLKQQRILASFFFTGDFYRNKRFHSLIRKLIRDKHYLGPHSDKHLLYNDWNDRQKVLLDQDAFKKDLLDNYQEMKKHGIDTRGAKLFLPPYEWYNRTISAWAEELGVTTINYTPGTISHTDYKSPLENGKYYSSQQIHSQILEYEKKETEGLRGFILLSHVGAGPGRPDKFFLRLDSLLSELKRRGYRFLTVDALPQYSTNLPNRSPALSP